MFKQIFSKLPRKSSRSSEYREQGGSGNHAVHSNASSTSPSSVNLTANLVPLSYEALPEFKDVPSSEKQSLFIKKLKMCCVVFDFVDPTKHTKEKEIKRQTLVELVDHVTSANSKFTEIVMQEVVKLVSINIFRTFSPQPRENKVIDALDVEVEDEEPPTDPAWPHLQMVHELFLKFVVSPALDVKLAKRYIDQSFILKLLDLFDSEDPREREYLKTILHRIYGIFMVHRPFIRKAINNIFYRFVFETEKHNGIAEFLEILGSIINGFALPLKEEHKLFLVRVLIPLHKPKCLAMYHQQLSYCITQFVEKDCELADTIIRGLLKYWPITNSSKEVMFLSELEEVLKATQSPKFQHCMVPLFRQIAQCLNSSHFQVAERALSLWNNDHIENLIKQNRKVILPIIFPALDRNARSHWNQAVHSLTLNVKETFYDLDPDLFKECLRKFEEDLSKEGEVTAKREATWKRLEELAAKNAASSEAVLIHCKAPHHSSSDGRKDEDLARFAIAAHSCETFSYNTLAAATHNFDTDNLIGKGAFGPIYKGTLPDGREIAVKSISKTFSQGRSAFNNEIELLCRLHHRNVVKLYGYCAQNDECLLLVYEYVPHGSLDQHLFNPNRSSELLDWRLRYQIIIGIAKGLSYLHGDSQNGSIIHRDINSRVILLDNKWNPKISDFGIGRQLLEDRTHLTTATVGTMGYLAPESLVHRHVTVKTDIFSFGVLMLELISGKKPYTQPLNDDDPGLLHWAHQLYEENRILELMNPTLEDSADLEQVTNCIKIGLLCTQDDPVHRPDIDRVMSMLTGNQVVAEIPVIRSRFFRSTLSDDDESQISYSDGSEFEEADSAASDTHGHMPAGDQQIQHVLSNSIQLMQDGREGCETLNDPLQRPHMDGVVTMSVGNQGDEFEETVNIEEEIPDHIPMDEQQIHDGPSNSNQPMQDDPHSNSFTAHAQDYRERNEDENFENKIAAQNCQKFSFETLCNATNEFASQNMLGQGNFGLVYKGTLNDGREIAVKKSLEMSEQHRNSLITEVELLSRVKHPNVVKLLGYCVDDARFLLVYEYVPNKSLDKLLFDSSGRKQELDWATTYRIILGIARGLSYLHADSQNRIIHRDIKADNILLDHKWEPKIADFGISRLFDADQTHVFTNLAGTRGYWAPEYAMQQHLTVKADVYSFGVLVIELITGKRNLSFPPPENYRGGRFDWANKLLKRNKISEIMDPALKGSADMKQVVNCIEIGLHCTQFDPKKRPKMENVVSKLIGYDCLRESRRSGLFG